MTSTKALTDGDCPMASTVEPPTVGDCPKTGSIETPTDGTALREAGEEGSNAPVAGLVVIVLGLVFGLVLFGFSYLRYRTFKAHIHDLGLISQTLWSTLQGYPFRNSINPEIGYSANYLGNHFSPGLLAWLPVYALVGSPVALLLAQSFVLALGVWPFYRLCRDELDPWPAAALTGLWVIQPALWFSGLYDFHHETSCATLGLVVWLCHRRDRPFLMCLVLAFMASLKEHIPLLTAAFGVYLALFTQRRRLGVGIALVSVVYLALVMGLFVPYFNDTSSHSYFDRRYPHLGKSARDALVTCLTHPLDVLGFMATPRHLHYVTGLLAPWMFLPLLAPEVLLIPIPILFVNMQSRIEVSYDLGFYHSDTCLPWIGLAALLGFVRLRRLAPRLHRRWGPRLPIFLLAQAVFWHVTAQSAFLPGYRPPLSPLADHRDYRLTDHHRLIDRISAMIPREATLSVQTDLACFFTNRHGLYPFPHRMNDADFVLVDLTEPYGHRSEYRLFWLEYSFQTKASVYCQSVRRLFEDPGLVLVADEDGYLLFARRAGKGLPREPALARLEARCREWTRWTGRGYGYGRASSPIDGVEAAQ